jgi:hypothetical protein
MGLCSSTEGDTDGLSQSVGMRFATCTALSLDLEDVDLPFLPRLLVSLPPRLVAAALGILNGSSYKLGMVSIDDLAPCVRAMPLAIRLGRLQCAEIQEPDGCICVARQVR